LGDWLLLLNGLALIVLINMLVSTYFFRIDLTEEGRYTIKPQTRELLASLDDDVYVEVYLTGDLNASFRRFQKAIGETLGEFSTYSNNRVRVVFTDPLAASGEKAQAEFVADLASRGIQPTNVIDNQNGQRVEKIIFPGVSVAYNGMEVGVMLLKGNKAATPAEEINQSIEGIEYELANAIHKLVNTDRRRIGLVRGHGELDSVQIASFVSDISELYEVTPLTLTDHSVVGACNALVIAKPTQTFSAADKYALDQYIMRGGKVLFLMDRLDANMDSASREDYFALPYQTDLDDQLFRYGVRINFDLVQDRSASFYPVITGQLGGKPQVQLLEWPFFPLLNHYPDIPLTRNLDAVLTRFVSSMDTVKAEGIRKTPLLMTSQYSRVLAAPVKVSVNDLRRPLPDDAYSGESVPVAYLLEGKFTSLYKNRFLPDGVEGSAFREESVNTAMIVVADGDMVRNEVSFRNGQPQPHGFDPTTNYTFANRDFVMNALAYLVDENGLIQARNKQVKIRPLDRGRIAEQRFRWQFINLVVPLFLLVLFGMGRWYWRSRRFARF
jgi:gliding-associated putative ABC transporter substrate-binding component GldG